MAASAPTFATQALASDPPLPIAATFASGTGLWSVTFDALLQPGPVAIANWFLRVSNFAPAVITATAVMNRVQGTTSGGSPDIGPDGVTFTPPPFDVVERVAGKPAAAFADFPLVVT